MKFREIFRFEFAYQLHRVSTWLCFAVLLSFAFLIMVGSRPTDGAEFLNAPFAIAFFTVLAGAIWLMIAATVAGEAAARDVQTRMYPLVYSAPVSKAEYLGGRFLAAFVVNALVLLAVPAGILLGISSPWVEAGLLGPFRPVSYLTAYGVIALPFAFVATAIQFSGAALSGRPMASYLASVLLLVTSTFVPMAVVQLLGKWELVRLLDLVGIASIINLGDTWTVIEKNTRLVGLEGTLLGNRLVWFTVAVGVLVLTYLRFRLAHPAESTRRRRRRDVPLAMTDRNDVARIPIAVSQVQQAFGSAAHARQTLGIAWASFRAVAQSRSGLVLLVAIPVLAFLALPQNLELQGVPLLPRTGYVLTFLTAPVTDTFTPWVVIPLLIVLYAGDLVWRERDAGLGEITDAAPVPEWVVVLGKFLGLGLVLGVFMALLALAGVLVQVSRGYYDFEIELYLQVLFGLQLPEYLLFAVLVLVVQALIDNKHLGHLVALGTYGYIAFASNLGIEHHLLVYGSAPAWSHSEMRGFGPSLEPWLWFKLYWAAWALLFAVVARLLWVRGTERSLRGRFRLARRRFTRPTAWTAGAALGLVLVLGGFVFYNTSVLNEYLTSAEVWERRAEYERRYGQYEGVPQPRLIGTRLHVEIYPERRAVEVRGTYHLMNGTAMSIDSIHVTPVPGVETGAITFDRSADLVLTDERLGHRIYVLTRPLQPGDSLRFGFEVRAEPRGFGNGGVDPSVAANGTYFTNEAWLPAVGYQPGRELRQDKSRRSHGLAPRPFFRSLYDAEARQDSTGKERIAFEAVVGTDADQVAVAPGALRRTWTEGGRRYFRYSTDAPIGNEYAFFSADYAVRDGQWHPPDPAGHLVEIRIYHQPRRTANLDVMLRSVRASLAYYSVQFGPYPYRHITLVEHSGIGGMSAPPSLITFQEGFSLFDQESDSLAPDFPFAVVAHEVAHQWWGSHLTPPRVEGTPLLSESLAEYSALQVVKKTYGQERLHRYLGLLRARSEARGKRAALPLLRASDGFHQYTKGPLVMYALSEYVGEERVNRALRLLLAQHRSEGLVTTLDLHRELQTATPDSLQYLLHDLFERNTFWDLETEAVTAVQTDAGAWQVALEVRARKLVVDGAGVETEVPMDDWVEVGAFAPATGGQALREPLYLQKHRLRSGRQTVTLTLPHKPALAGIDPFHVLEWAEGEVDNNLVQVEIRR
jgi:ABC-2 type transport system permease protein